ncbi:repressor LexA [Breznakia sp. PF5-3]|uniref:LexA family protein n=1 Tax=unclassified Breznakia TaxID=2623764 RepID=UPI002404F5A7|nr:MULTISPECIES: LexA family transcriptional regulator [unclassified Breznakia]MDF9825746.1 repressor LexA [Breznakia sp. PM6-1]MDF9836563.1 repressor LexA [Breznakia sp. PF5-3]MDF9838781.1 repressor LexA [Breznakia sp. PFB2-8]MDF9860805.1 repressor LexA [Breznakia sp. PH5-24]
MNVNVIKKQMEKLNLTSSDIAEGCDVGVSSVYRWLSGSTTKITKEKMIKLAELLGVSVHVLEDETTKLIKPILGTVKAGYDHYANEDVLGYEEVNTIEAKRGDYFLKVKGDSMIGDGIFDGDLVYVKQIDEVPDHSIAVVLVGEEVTIKRFEKKDELIILTASNPSVPMRTFNRNEVVVLPVRILGQVVYAKRVFV